MMKYKIIKNKELVSSVNISSHNPKNSNKIIKYTRIPNYDYNPDNMWCSQASPSQIRVRLRRVISIEDINIYNTSRSVIPGFLNHRRCTPLLIQENKLYTPAICNEAKKNHYTATHNKQRKKSKQGVTTKPSIQHPKIIKENQPPDKGNAPKTRCYISSANKIHVQNGVDSNKYNSIKNRKIAEEPAIKKKSQYFQKKHNNVYVSNNPDSKGAQVILKNEINEKYKLKCSSRQENVLPGDKINIQKNTIKSYNKNLSKTDSCTGMKKLYRETFTETQPLPLFMNQYTSTDNIDYTQYKDVAESKQNETQTDVKVASAIFEELEVPKVSLVLEKSYTENCHSMLNMPKIQKNLSSTIEERDESKRKSFVIGQATLTYTTKQEINFHLLGGNSNTLTNVPHTSLLSNPFSVMSAVRKEFKRGKTMKPSSNSNSTFHEVESKIKTHTEKSFVCRSKLKKLPHDELMKPSPFFSDMLTHTSKKNFLSEQFNKELNFINSFCNSLEYLEKCASMFSANLKLLYEKEHSMTALNLNSTHRDVLMSNIEHSSKMDYQSPSSKNLCLLNFLIRDERRRAKNLMFVLKMREDTLKDFTKSQILWLENRKKHENKDIAALKKKQRGALLKLQHEFGEMQRMRKTLLMLSEKRKASLLQTKKNIELRLDNPINDMLSTSKKKLKCPITNQKQIERRKEPIKCFELSSQSICVEESFDCTTGKGNTFSDSTSATKEIGTKEKKQCPNINNTNYDLLNVSCAVKSIPDQFVVVNGKYLNILFRGFSLTDIFSNEKEYEVNEEALRNILNLSNKISESSLADVAELSNNNLNHYKIIDRSSTPSTARSLVEEFDEYYKNFGDSENGKLNCKPDDGNDNHLIDLFEKSSHEHNNYEDQNVEGQDSQTEIGNDYTDCFKQFVSNDHERKSIIESLYKLPNGFNNDSQEKWSVQENNAVETSYQIEACDDKAMKKNSTMSWDTKISAPWILPPQDSATVPLSIENGPPNQVTVPVTNISEAEELRMKQLAIELEIKVLEQQQKSQLFLMREIPDKPPPPYTPPVAEKNESTRGQVGFAEFSNDGNILNNFILNYCKHFLSGNHREKFECETIHMTENFYSFLCEFCFDKMQKYQVVENDKPWNPNNILPQKTDNSIESLKRTISLELAEVLENTFTTPSVSSSNVYGKKVDCIDDILFSEWRKCEPDWTSLETDEVHVKNQIFESVFQKILTESVKEYKRIVLFSKKKSAQD